MKKSSKYCCIVTAIGLILGFVVFYLLTTELMVVPEFPILFIATTSIGILALLGILISTLIARKSKSLKEAFCCCGNLAVIGGIGTILFSVISSLLVSSSAYFFIISLSIFFLTLLLGGIWCFLLSYFKCGKKCICEKTCTFEDDDLQEDIND